MPDKELSLIQKAVYGEDSRLHPVTNLPVEIGSGALSERGQGYAHLNHILLSEGEAAMVEMRRRLDEHYAHKGAGS